MSERHTIAQPPEYSYEESGLPMQHTPQVIPPATYQPQFTGSGVEAAYQFPSPGNVSAIQPQHTGAPHQSSPLPPDAYPQSQGGYPQPAQSHPQPAQNAQQPQIPVGSDPNVSLRVPPVSSPEKAVGAQRTYQTATPLTALNEGAAPVDCPACGQRALTRAEYKAGSRTHIWALVLGLLILLPCIPYFMDSTKDVKHSCGNCGVHLATWRRGARYGGGEHTQVFQYA